MTEIMYLEMGSGDVTASSDFFVNIFGWSFASMGGNEGGWFDAAPLKIGLHGGDPKWGIVPYFKVDDIQAASDKVRDFGGEADAKTSEEGFGWFVNCKDPQGMKFGLHQPFKAA